MLSKPLFTKTVSEVSVPVLMLLLIDVAQQIQDRKTVDADMLEHVSLIEICIAELKRRQQTASRKNKRKEAEPCRTLTLREE